MKKFLILSVFLFAVPAFASCPIDGSETVCSLPGFREQVTPSFNPRGSVREFADSPEVTNDKIERSEITKQIRDFAPIESDFNYNSSCQFGVCFQDRSTPLFQQPKY